MKNPLQPQHLHRRRQAAQPHLGVNPSQRKSAPAAPCPIAVPSPTPSRNGTAGLPAASVETTLMPPISGDALRFSPTPSQTPPASHVIEGNVPPAVAPLTHPFVQHGQELRRPLSRPCHEFQEQQAAQNPVPFRNMPSEAVAPALLSRHQRILLHHQRPGDT